MDEKKEKRYDPKSLGVVVYLTWIGFVIALVLRDKDDEYLAFHLNQALVLNIFALIPVLVPTFGVWSFLETLYSIFIFVLWIIAFVGACQGQKTETPLLGQIHLLK